ncbi:MAG: FeoB small GTPase domain-containing protein [Caldilineaceae bacterium]
MSETIEQTIPLQSHGHACETCPIHRPGNLIRLGIDMTNWDFVVALAGNPNTGKSTIFNALTGLRQHTGTGRARRSHAEGLYGDHRYKVSRSARYLFLLLSTTLDEEVARNFILFGQPDVTIIVADATRLERNLNLVLQVLEITNHAVLALNLIDEAKRHGLKVDERSLARDLGIPVVPMAARQRQGVPDLLQAVSEVATGQTVCRPHRIKSEPPALKQAVADLVAELTMLYPNLPNARWVAMRLLDGDQRIIEAIEQGELGDLTRDDPGVTTGTLHAQWEATHA